MAMTDNDQLRRTIRRKLLVGEAAIYYDRTMGSRTASVLIATGIKLWTENQ